MIHVATVAKRLVTRLPTAAKSGNIALFYLAALCVFYMHIAVYQQRPFSTASTFVSLLKLVWSCMVLL
jgi:hypothetical protein